MRLETDITTATPPFDSFAEAEKQPDLYEESRDQLTAGIRYAQRGDRTQARTALLRCTEIDPRNENAWLWLASISEYPEELLVFLNNVLEINPHNARALDWRIATNSLLAKTFVQRGIDAVEENQKEHASDYFSKALEYDQNNSLAWMWMASLSESHDGQLLYLEKALAIDPTNEAAFNAYKSVKREITARHLADAKAAAVSGRLAEANELLNAVLEVMPESEDAWMMRAHFAVSFDEKISSFERVLEINPNNVLAATSLESLRSLLGMSDDTSGETDTTLSNSADPLETESLSFEPVTESIEPEMPIALADHSAETKSDTSHASAEPFSSSDEFPTIIFDHSSVKEEVREFEPASQLFEDEVLEQTTAQEESEIHISLEIPAETHDAELSAGQSSEQELLKNEGSYFPVMDLPESAPVKDAFSFDDDTIEETRPSYEDATDTISDHSSAAFADEATTAFSPDENVSVPEIAQYTATPVIFEPSSAPTEEIPVIEEESPLPFGNTLMFSLQADELELKEEAAPLSSVAYSNGSDDDQDLSASIPMPLPESATESVDDVAFSIPMPLDNTFSVAEGKTGFETTVFPQAEESPVQQTVVPIAAEKKTCIFCSSENDNLAVSCQNCMAVLTLSDLEMLISNQNADRAVLRDAVERLETKRSEASLSEYELTMLGIAYLNMRDLNTGYERLSEASQLNPNNVILSSQVNALHIRAEEIKAKEVENGSLPKGKTILVVDDSPTIRKLISGKLEKSGHEVFCSADGVDAMEQLAVLHPDLVLLDITMPRMDGYQVCKLIRGNDATKDVPVVMISGKDGFFDKVRGRMAGSSGYITKPFGPETLMKVVEGYLNNGH